MNGSEIDNLITSVAAGNTDSLEKLYDMCAKGVYALCRSIVGDHATAEDITQDTFVRVWSGAKGFTPNGNGRAWIYRIARNLSLNAVTRRRTDSLDRLNEENGERFADSRSTENNAVNSEAVRQALECLTDTERQIVVLHAMSGLSLSEIAEMTDTPPGTVKWRHAEAMKKMKKALGAIY